jgi:nitrite reductase (NADH) small subunit/3-phenylpropionate/trans-cinnamate dioxygenase ferredoxin subunit
MGLHKVCRTTDLKEGESGTLQVGRKIIAVFRTADGFHAIDNMCPHMGAELSGGYVADGVVTCPWHYWRFRLTDGAWADNPRIKIGCYPVTITDDEIYVEVADAATS